MAVGTENGRSPLSPISPSGPMLFPFIIRRLSRSHGSSLRCFPIMGLPDVLHSDQGRNFESTLLRQTLESFGVHKTHTTAYHPEGDGMVERFNRSLLQLLRSYVDEESDWEQYLPLVLYAYPFLNRCLPIRVDVWKPIDSTNRVCLILHRTSLN